MPLRGVLLLATLSSLVACRCDRGTSLSGRYAELVIVQAGPNATEQLVREAQVGAPRTVMGETSNGTFVVRNIGDARLTLTKISLAEGSTAFAVELPEKSVLEASEEVTFTIVFSPDQAADPTLPIVPHEATFLIESSGGRDGELTATVDVTAEAEARDCYVPPLLDFGEAPIGQTVWMPLPLSNATVTAAQATLSAVSGPNPAFFSVEPVGPTVDVPAQTMLTAQVRFAPLTEMPVVAELGVKRRASCPQGLTRLQGSGSTQSISWLPTEVDFGRVPLNETASRVVTFTNRSGAAIDLAIATNGADFSTPNAMGTLASRSTTTITVSCRPTSLSALTGTLVVDVGTSPVLPIRIPLRCSGGGPRLRASPSPLAFGAVPVLLDATGRPAAPSLQPAVFRRLRIENVGTPPLAAGDTTFNLVLGRAGQLPYMSLTPLGATGQSEFQIGLGAYPDGGVPALVGRNSIDLEVKLKPAGVGLKEALLTIYSNDAVQPAQSVRLTANATVSATCNVSSAPATMLFSDIPPDFVASQVLTLTNNGREPCIVSGLEIAPGTGRGFVLAPTTPTSTTLSPGASLPVTVQFNSAGIPVGTAVGGFVRFSHAGVSTPVLVPLSARVAECVVIVPEEVDFGNVKVGCRSSPRVLQIFNTCGTPTRLGSVSLTGQPFAISAAPSVTPGASIPANGKATLSLVFGQVMTPGNFLGTLQVVTGDVGSTRTTAVPLRGVGDMTGITTETWQQPAQPQSDILFTVDNSCSMFDKQTALAANFGSFISYAQTANVDYRIAIATTDDFSPLGQGRFVQVPGVPTILERTTPNVMQHFSRLVNVGTGGAGLERPLSTTLKALSDPLKSLTNSGFLRDDANLAIIVVSDAPDQSLEVIDYYLTRLPQVKGVRRIHQVSVSVIGPFVQPPAGSVCTIEAVDDGRYAAVVGRTGGVQANICTSNWAMELEALGRSALGPRNTFFVKNPPDTGQPIDVSINGQPVSNAWMYDATGNSIVFQAGQAPGAGTTLSVTYQSRCL